MKENKKSILSLIKLSDREILEWRKFRIGLKKRLKKLEVKK